MIIKKQINFLSLPIVIPELNWQCLSPSPLLADIVRFDPLRIIVNLTVLKRLC